MSDIAIRVEKLSKRYAIGVTAHRHDTLRDVLAETLTAPLRSLGVRRQALGVNGDSLSPQSSPLTPHDPYIWALKDVSFEVKEGEIIGVIGRNGAGKSTLLKILSRITEPTEGHAYIHGRIGSLLEVGTGFHHELTGRENIYLNGAILGMKKAEIDRKFDEIVDFSGVEHFIDTPVKHYSSGMHVRLAFAVAAHLEPEILVVDEVLAVGDAQFQKKCLGKMQEVSCHGRTVLFVSHNMNAISLLCSSTILLANSIAAQGSTPEVIRRYLSSASSSSAEALWSFEKAPGTDVLKLCAVRVLNDERKVCFNVTMDKPITLQAEFWILRKTRMQLSFHLYNHQGTL